MNSLIQSEVHTECNHHCLLLGKFRIDNPGRYTSFYIPSFPRIFSKLYKKALDGSRKIWFQAVCIFVLLLNAFCSKAQLSFIENRGQWPANVQYRGDFKTGAFFLERNGFTVLLHDTADLKRIAGIKHPVNGVIPHDKKSLTLHSVAYQVSLVGANDNAIKVADKSIPGYNNYYIGNDHTKWASRCKVFQSVTYQNIYPSIDIRYYIDAGNLKYDFIVHPGGDPSRIAMHYEGVNNISIKEKQLLIKTPVGDIRELRPYSYQPGSNQRETISCNYQLKDNIVTFSISSYNKNNTLIIDPSIIFCTFTGSTADNWGYTATPGNDGTFYAGGIAFNNGYPTERGYFQEFFGGGDFDIAIIKYSSDGFQKLYATYLGGNGEEQPHSMIVDGNGNLVIAGRTNSANFPLRVPRIGPGGDDDIFISKFNSDATDLIGSVKIGGTGKDGVNIRPKDESPFGDDGILRNYGDDARSEVILDGAGNIFLASCTQSADFPIIAGNGIQSIFGGGRQDGALLKFNPDLSAPFFSTYFGGTGDDACFVASISPITGNIYIGGGTTSTSGLPGDTTGVIGPVYRGGLTDGFVTEIRADGTGVLKTSYFGTDSIDIVYGLKFDKQGYPYIMGTTTGIWPVINATFRNTGGKQFISKLRPNLSGYVYSTVFGTNSPVPNISPLAFLVDNCENVYVSGWGGSVNLSFHAGNTSLLPEVNPLPNIPAADGADLYFFVLEKNAQSQLFGSHFGQNGGGGDHVDGGTSRFDERGVIYQAECANCNGVNTPGIIYPAGPVGVWSLTNNSDNCNQAAIKIDMNFSGVSVGLQAAINSVINDTIGCIPLHVEFKDTLQNGVKFFWNFGDGTLDTTFVRSNEHDYLQIGIYKVMLIAEDSSTCNIRDTSYVTIKASDNIAHIDFLPEHALPCESFSMKFTNLSVPTYRTFGPKSFLWDYGDGSPFDTAGLTPPRIHQYPGPGTYTVTLYIIDTVFCNESEFTQKVIEISPPTVTAAFESEKIICEPYRAAFTNTSIQGITFKWEFGDGTFSTDKDPVHIFPGPGNYNVRLFAYNDATCNKIDSTDFVTIRVYQNPVASFDWSPNPPIANTPTLFTNGTTGADHYQWYFGDGESSTLTNPSYQYNETLTFTATLIATNAVGCADTANRTVRTLIDPLLDVPNAFTPGQTGLNQTVKVEGFGIGKMEWKIYNRWGQLVFHTNDRKQSWDGTFKGKLQPMDVYSYTLEVTFTNGKKTRKTGDISLLR